MIQLLYEYSQPWPVAGPMRLESPPIALDIPISPDSARRRVNGYLTMYVSMALVGADPVLVMKERKPFWRVSMNLRWPGWGYISTLGHVDVDAQTRDVVPLSIEQIQRIQDKADALIKLIASDPEATV
ncbi:MAG: hypothetical protein AAF702_15360 [Chloroflexota bacterium]